MLIEKFKNLKKDIDLQIILFAFMIPLLFLLIGKYSTETNSAFYGISPHPYLVISIILSAYYGLKFALILSPILSIQYLILLHYQTDYQAVETIITVKYLSLPLAIIILSALVGEFKTRSLDRVNLLKADNKDKEELTVNLIDKINLATKESYEIKKQLVNKLDTTTSIFSKVKGLNALNKDKLFDNFMEIINEQLSIKSSAIYLLNIKKDTLNLYKSSLDQKTSDIPASLDIINGIEDKIIKKAIESKSLVSIKDIYNDKELLKDFNSVLACPIQMKDTFYGIIIIYKMPFLQYSPSNFKLLELYCDWLANSLSHALEFETMTRNSIFNPTLNIYTNRYFLDRIKEELALAKRYKTQFAIISYRIINTNMTTDTHLARIRKLFTSILNHNTRKMDYIAEGETPDIFYSLINMTEKSQYKELLKRIIKSVNEINDDNTKDEILEIEISYVLYNNQNDFAELKKHMELYNA